METALGRPVMIIRGYIFLLGGLALLACATAAQAQVQDPADMYTGPPGIPGTPESASNPDTPTVVGFIIVSSAESPVSQTDGFGDPPAYANTAVPGDLVFLINANGGDGPSNWAAVAQFTNPNDPDGQLGLAATEDQSFSPAEFGPSGFSNFSLLPNVYYLTSGPISSEAQETFTELGPDAGDILAGQVLIDVVTIAVPEPSSMKLLGVSLAVAVFSIGSMHTFQARIRKNWIMRCVDVPEKIVQALGGGRGIPVLARYCGETAETTVVPGGGGKGRLILRMDILRPAGLEAGDTVEVSLEPDHASREPEVPPDFQRALRFRPEAAQAFQRAPVSGRRQIMLYIDAAKREETRASRIERIIERLSEDAKRA